MMYLDLHLPKQDAFWKLRERFREFKISALVKDTANPLSHHALASSNFFNLMQAIAPVKA